jgi:adenylate cyclase
MANGPGADEVRSALERVLASDCFSSASRPSGFLRYVVEETLAGRGDRLKGYTIAVEVFDKPGNFDTQSDSQVRVEAARLRQRLAQYYGSEGADAPVRIELKRGGYAPEFSYALPKSAESTSALQDAAPRGSWASPRHRLPAGAIALALAVAGLGIASYLGTHRAENMQSGQAEQPGPPKLEVDTFRNIGDPDFDYFAYGLTEEVALSLGRRFLGWGTLKIYRDADLKDLDIRQTPIDYRLTGTVTHLDDSIRVTARLVDVRTGRQLWTKGYTAVLEVDKLVAVEQRVATDVVTTVAEPLGPISDEETARSLQRPLETLDAYDCRLRYNYALETISPAAQAPAKQCLERFAAAGSLDATGWAILSMLYRWEYEGGYDLAAGTQPSLDRALEAARRALDMDGNQFLTHDAMALVRLASGDDAGARRSVERAFTFAPPPAGRVVLGIDLIRLGERERGMQVVTTATAQAPRSVPYFFLGPTIYYTSLGDYEQALRSAKRIDAPDFIMGQVFVAALAAHVGQNDLARQGVQHILAMHPKFSNYGRELIGRWHDGPTVEAALVEGLELAGLTLQPPKL